MSNDEKVNAINLAQASDNAAAMLEQDKPVRLVDIVGMLFVC